jgi:hypothetical protein
VRALPAAVRQAPKLRGGFWTGMQAMRSDDALDGSDGSPPLLKAAMAAGLAALSAAALAVGAAGGTPPAGAPGHAAASGPRAGLAAAGGGRGPAALPPVSRLCFHGSRGEPVDFPVVLDCP